MDKKFALAEAVEIANYYWPTRNIDHYFYKKWLRAEMNLENKLEKLLNR